MVSILSPGVYVLEQDTSTYPVTIGGSTVGLVGVATKGPFDKPTLITSQENLIKTFGYPNSGHPGQGLEAALEILEVTDSVYFVRVGDGSQTAATANVDLASCPAVGIAPGKNIGTTASALFVVSGLDNAGNAIYPGGKFVEVPLGSVDTQTALAKAFGTNLDSLKVTAQYPVDSIGVPSGITGANADAGALVLSFAGSQARLYVSSNVAAAVASFAADGTLGSFANSVNAQGYAIATNVAKYEVESIEKGTGYNETSVNGVTRGNSIEVKNLGGALFEVVVNEDGGQYESFKTSFVNNTTNILKVMGNTSITSNSDVVFGDLVGAAGSVATLSNSFFSNGLGSIVAGATGPRFVKLLPGSYPLSNGDDGEPTAGVYTPFIGDSATKTGLYSLDDEGLNLTVALVPGIHAPSVQDALITLAEETTNFIAIVSPPKDAVASVQEAIDWSNGLSNERRSAINSSYAAIYWPHVHTFIPTIGNDVWLDPAIYGARQIVYTASVSELWSAPAGFVRGRLTKPHDVDYPLNQGDRDALYSGGNVINPIVNFPQQGITIFGQRTAQRAPSALDRINIRLLTIYLKKVLLRSMVNQIFEPNDPILWKSIDTVARTILDDIKIRRGISEFNVVCDATTNTAARIERNELWCKIIIKPTKTAEAIVFELNLAAQSATI